MQRPVTARNETCKETKQHVLAYQKTSSAAGWNEGGDGVCLDPAFNVIITLDLQLKQTSDMASYCQPCDRSFVNQAALQQHLDSSIHAPQTFSNQRAINKHLNNASAFSAHAAVCYKCDRKFNNQQALNQHLSSLAHNKPDPSFGLINRRLHRYGIVFLG